MVLALWAVSGLQLIRRSWFLAEWFCTASFVSQNLCSFSLTQLGRKEKVTVVLECFPQLEFSYCIKWAVGSNGNQPSEQLRKVWLQSLARMHPVQPHSLLFLSVRGLLQVCAYAYQPLICGPLQRGLYIYMEKTCTDTFAHKQKKWKKRDKEWTLSSLHYFVTRNRVTLHSIMLAIPTPQLQGF